MSRYIELADYGKYMEFERGDIIYVASDTRRVLSEAMRQYGRENFDPLYHLNKLIDGLIEALGTEGTLLFPTFNWDFCHGGTFDPKTTECKTGILGTLALQRPEFRRTKHPLYSFAVYGKCQDELCSMENTDSFGLDSPFAYFVDRNVKQYFLDAPLSRGFTFPHFTEQQSGVVKYRYLKNFTSNYMDEQGNESVRTYSMFVRDLDLDVHQVIDRIEPDLLEQGAERKIYINRSVIRIVSLKQAHEIAMKDVVENRSRKLCAYIGQ